MSSPSFRLAQEQDLVAIQVILNQAIERGGLNAFTSTVSLANRQQWLKKHPTHNFPVYVVDIKGTVVGWLSYSPYRAGRSALAGTTEIAYYLHNDWQRQGLGKQVLQFIIDLAPSLGFTHLLAILMDTNIGSARLLEQHKFQQWGHLPNIAQLTTHKAGQWYYGLAL